MFRHSQQRSDLTEFDQNQDGSVYSMHMHPQENGFNSSVSASRIYNTSGPQQRIHGFPDYPTELESQKSQKGFSSGAGFRSSFSLHPISNHTRPQSQGNASYDHPNAYGSSEMYPPQLTSPTQSSLQPFDPRGSFEFPNGSATAHSSSQRSPALLESFMGPQQSTMMLTQLKGGSQHHGNGFGHHTNGSYAVSSQTPFGPHIPSSATGSSTPMNPAPATSTTGVPAPSQSSHQHEEISTIFVVGFPDDMQEREFQNMFTFCPDFEAATLKIPNQSSTYGSTGNGATRTTGSSFHQFLPGANEGFTSNIVVDSRDGTVSWPSMDDGAGGNSFAAGGAQGNIPPRKQIIGFAKFKTKEGAFRAREQLQGRRVDIEKGAILKAEMAKKNLHTKRGVGPIPGSTTSGTGMAPTGNTPQPPAQPTTVTAVDVFGPSITDGHTIRDSGNIAGTSRVSHWREHALDPQVSSPQFAPIWDREVGNRSHRERLFDDAQEKWLAQDQLNQASFLRLNADPVELGVGLAPVAEHLEEDLEGYTAGPWDNLSGPVPQPSLSRRSSSEANFVEPSHVYPHSSRSSNEEDHRGMVEIPNTIPSDIGASLNGLSLSTRQNSSSPELPSPSSNSSGGSGGKPGVDQNPPINTLYVGNLPISPLPPNLPADALEERLRSLFADRHGFRRLSFKQKNTGPMCFVEFEDVHHATIALKALQSHTLGGLVKGGVRLSYSKNPLGVRTPTSATSSSSQQQSQTLGGAMDDNRSIYVRSDRTERRDHSQPYISSPPPPRFSNPSTTSYFGLGSTQEFVPRANYQYSMANELASFGSYGRSPFSSDLLTAEPGASRVLSPTSS